MLLDSGNAQRDRERTVSRERFDDGPAETGVPRRRRTRARKCALEFLYMLDLRGEEMLEELEGFLEGEPDRSVRRFARDLIEGVRREREELDRRITEATDNWVIERMAVIDRNILRLASYELLRLDDVPPKVTINEAIELAKKFSTAESSSFVNGVLDKVKSEI